MGVHLEVGMIWIEVGSSDFLRSFFDTVEVRLTKGLFKPKFPTVLDKFYNGRLDFEDLDTAEKELIQIREKLKKFKPDKVVWDKFNPDEKPPWGDNISKDITSLSNYFVTSDGRDLFDAMFQAIRDAREQKCEIEIK